jgi:hypothetical protein
MAKIEYGCLMLNYPIEFSKQVSVWNNSNIPDHILYLSSKNDTLHGREHHVHTTVSYGFDQDITLGIIKQVCVLPKITVTLGEISAFTQEKKFDVFKIKIFSDELVQLQKDISSVIGTPGNTYKEYNPHLTLAYIKKGKGDYLYDRNFPLTGSEVTLSEYEYSYPNTTHGREHDWYVAM